MSSNRRFRRTLRAIRTHWPIYFSLYGALVLALLLIGVGLAAGWYSFIPFSLAIMLVASYFLISTVYTAYLIHDAPGGTAAQILFDLAQTKPDDRVVCVDLGLKDTAVSIAAHLTTGQVTVIDIYNPQSNVKSSLRRARRRAIKPPADPRLNWIDGSIELLPLPDRSVHAVYINAILSEFWLTEERDQLLAELFRILIPEGRILIAEPVRSHASLLWTGIITYFQPTERDWREVLTAAGFVMKRQELARGLVFCARFDKPSPTAGKQMSLNLEYI